MRNFDLKVIGLAELEQDFKDLAKALQDKALQEAVTAGSRVAAKAIKQAAPKKTGKLKKHIKVKKLNKKQSPTAATSGVTFGKGFHGWFVEEGTVNAPAYPFARPTWDANIDQIEEATNKQLGISIDKKTMGIK